MQDLKLKFYQLMIELCHNEGGYLAICRHYNAVLETPCIQEDKEKMKEVKFNAIILAGQHSFNYPPSFLSRYLERLVRSLVYLPYFMLVFKQIHVKIIYFNY